MAEYWGLSARRFLRALTEGWFDELLGEAAERWRTFCAALADDGHGRAVLRLYAGEQDGGPYFLWVVYAITAHDDVPGLRLDAMILPADGPEGRLATPDEVQGEPFFAYPPGEPRVP